MLTTGFLCLLDDNEGGNLLSADKPDIAVGRIPVVNDAQAKVVVDKIVAYNTNHNAGDWQNTIFFMGDDGNEKLTHARCGRRCYYDRRAQPCLSY